MTKLFYGGGGGGGGGIKNDVYTAGDWGCIQII